MSGATLCNTPGCTTLLRVFDSGGWTSCTECRSGRNPIDTPERIFDRSPRAAKNLAAKKSDNHKKKGR